MDLHYLLCFTIIIITSLHNELVHANENLKELLQCDAGRSIVGVSLGSPLSSSWDAETAAPFFVCVLCSRPTAKDNDQLHFQQETCSRYGSSSLTATQTFDCAADEFVIGVTKSNGSINAEINCLRDEQPEVNVTYQNRFPSRFRNNRVARRNWSVWNIDAACDAKGSRPLLCAIELDLANSFVPRVRPRCCSLEVSTSPNRASIISGACDTAGTWLTLLLLLIVLLLAVTLGLTLAHIYCCPILPTGGEDLSFMGNKMKRASRVSVVSHNNEVNMNNGGTNESVTTETATDTRPGTAAAVRNAGNSAFGRSTRNNSVTYVN